jgi:hypothetical protein
MTILKRSHSFWDQIGMGISTICFVHCAILPFFLLGLPWVAEYLEDSSFHLVIFFLIVPIGLYAFFQGYGHHKNKWVLILGIPGLFLVSFAAFFPHGVTSVEHSNHDHSSPIITIIGSVLLVSAHFINRRTCRVHKH